MLFFKKDPLQIIVFLSYGTANHFYARGRALQDENINLDKKNIFSLLINSWKRFESDEVKNTSLTLTLPNNTKIETKTDKDGYFFIEEKIHNLNKLTNTAGWLDFSISYTQTNIGRKINDKNIFKGKLLIPSNEAEFGVISDIDDTILHTGVVSKLKWKLIINTFFKSPSKRKALEGASLFYRLLHAGISKKNKNPFFYVSHSPWNLYLYLKKFIEENNFPKGAILLRSFRTILKRKQVNEKTQKQKEIENILQTYPNLSFILIGDAGEYDADIYIEITKKYPKRIKAIYLRSVLHRKKMNRIKKLIENYTDTLFVVVNNSKEAIAHAKKNNFIA